MPKNNHLQIIDGVNSVKAAKTLGLIGASSFLIRFSAEENQSPLLTLLAIGGLLAYFKSVGEHNRPVSNLIANNSSLLNSKNPAKDLQRNNFFYNVFNGGAATFDAIAPTGLRNWFDNTF